MTKILSVLLILLAVCTGCSKDFSDEESKRLSVLFSGSLLPLTGVDSVTVDFRNADSSITIHQKMVKEAAVFYATVQDLPAQVFTAEILVYTHSTGQLARTVYRKTLPVQKDQEYAVPAPGAPNEWQRLLEIDRPEKSLYGLVGMDPEATFFKLRVSGGWTAVKLEKRILQSYNVSGHVSWECDSGCLVPGRAMANETHFQSLKEQMAGQSWTSGEIKITLKTGQSANEALISYSYSK